MSADPAGRPDHLARRAGLVARPRLCASLRPSYADSDGDGVGDLAGLTARLDYLNDGDPSTTMDLGVTGLWLMPTFPSPSYHGYDVTDYRGVNPDYGSLADLMALVAAAHKRGIAVILDLPLNHTSAQHPWFVASRKGEAPYADWYVWSDSRRARTGSPMASATSTRTSGPTYPTSTWRTPPSRPKSPPTPPSG